MDQETLHRLLDVARSRINNAIPSNSGFRVSAAALGEDGRTYVGVNWELINFDSECAERNAIGAAISAGNKRILALALYAPSKAITTPCGRCRQALIQYMAADAPILCANDAGTRAFTPAELLPFAFLSTET